MAWGCLRSTDIVLGGLCRRGCEPVLEGYRADVAEGAVASAAVVHSLDPLGDAADGWITAFATNTRKGQLADLELRHRRRARCEDRIRIAKDTGLANLPLHNFDANHIWCQLVLMAMELTAWTQLLAFRAVPAEDLDPTPAATCRP